jgi:MFS family permease
LFFGYLTDRFGRKKLFIITLVLYLVATWLIGQAADWLRAVLLRVSILHRGRHRRRVRGHQLGHRRADPGPGRPTRPTGRPDGRGWGLWVPGLCPAAGMV